MKRRRQNTETSAQVLELDPNVISMGLNDHNLQEATLSDKSTLTVLAVPPPSTPSKRKSRTASLNDEKTADATPSPQKRSNMRERTVRFNHGTISPPPLIANADQSARRKSVRHMMSRVLKLNDTGMSDEDEDSEDELGQEIFGGNMEEDSSEEEAIGIPNKEKLGRVQRKTYQPETSFLRLSEGVDSYFHQNRKARQQTSTSNLASLKQLDHTSYFQLVGDCAFDHRYSRQTLMEIHENLFNQWKFELMQGFNILLYGYGSKRKVLLRFASQAYTTPGSVIVFNGYNASATIKELLSTLSTALVRNSQSLKLGVTPNEQLDSILHLLESSSAPSRTYLIIHNIDGESIRSERSQSIISKLAAHPKLSLLASMDHIHASLLWDAARTSQLNFLYHDATTFEPYTAEIPPDDILSLIDGGGRAGGVKGVKYVLASLPSNAKRLFATLVTHQLQNIIDDPGRSTGKSGGEEYGIEYRVLYQKAISEFICTSDVAFRTLLKEFQDHQMISSKKDGQGTEVLWAPFRKEDLEVILDEING